MGQQFPSLSEKHIEFIAGQKLFFVATATENSRVNLSPKGGDGFRVLDANRVVWLNYTGSGNETAAHLRIHPRMTVMFCAFEGDPVILRLYGIARAIHHNDPDWTEFVGHFPGNPGARQVIEMRVELVQTSCGMSVPLYEYKGDRTLLDDWAQTKGEEGLREYWAKKNLASIDGLETGMEDGNLGPM
ncbi:MAG: pyridoxamine 5'-phosphate oxidase family protein [Fibrobacterota bacterium]